MSKYKQEIELARKLVKKAAGITEWFRETGFRTLEKRDHSPVTLADYASQIFINYNLRKVFPGDQIFAEEVIDELSSSQEEIIQRCFHDQKIDIKNLKSTLNYRGNLSNRQWTIDPVDGTKGFVEHLSYSIGISLVVNSEPIVSAIAAPNYDDDGLAVFSAELGQGAEASFGGRKFHPVHVSSQKQLKNARVCISLHNLSDATLSFLNKIGIKESNRLSMDGMGKFCKIADGSYDFYTHLNRSKMYSWDFCPGDLLVREAGGFSTDISGKKLQFKEKICEITAPGYVFSNEHLHKEILSFF
ncbi:MAG: hypothetical protein JW776_10870 [Candidatus Lokiarchaeota archaeon]|nr:hypothetical protein [Candidatus Lokiarchaeota archaeon]